MIKYELVVLPSFKRDYKRLKRKHIKVNDFTDVLYHLQYYNPKILNSKYNDHALHGNWQGYRELHLKPDLLIKYKTHKDTFELVLTRLGSHNQSYNRKLENIS